MNPASLTTLALAASAMLASSARATITTYAPPTIVGTTVTYPSVSESSATTFAPLYGAPTISGNDLIFSNMNFSATSVNATPAQSFTDGQINFTLQADAGSYLSSLNVSEFGDYNISATPNNPNAIDYVKVYPQALQITVLAENGVPLATPLVDNTSAVMVLSPSVGDFATNTDPSTGSWAGLVTANLSSLFGSTKITEVAISFDNQLLAESQTGGIATISKKGFDVDPTITTGAPTPEPASLSVIGLTGLIGLRRRR